MIKYEMSDSYAVAVRYAMKVQNAKIRGEKDYATVCSELSQIDKNMDYNDELMIRMRRERLFPETREEDAMNDVIPITMKTDDKYSFQITNSIKSHLVLISHIAKTNIASLRSEYLQSTIRDPLHILHRRMDIYIDLYVMCEQHKFYAIVDKYEFVDSYIQLKKPANPVRTREQAIELLKRI